MQGNFYTDGKRQRTRGQMLLPEMHEALGILSER